MAQAITALGLLFAIGGFCLLAFALCRAADEGDRQVIVDDEPYDVEREPWPCESYVHPAHTVRRAPRRGVA
jgi:hypothetical protein